MKRIILTCLGIALVTASNVRADVKLPNVFGSHMVLQREMPLPVWGWADPGEKVSVSLAGKSATAKANGAGKWRIVLPAMKADGKAHEMTVSGKNKIVLEDILIGEVWIGSGQSNMEWSLQRIRVPKTIAEATNNHIRLFHVPKKQFNSPQKDVQAKWNLCEPKTVPSFSAVLYYFGKKLNKDLDIPVGLINSSWGGSAIEPWTVMGKRSGGMYNGMIAPLQPIAMRGVIWYQGETNVLRKNGFKYYGKMNDLIGGWRKAWKREFPFYSVQIAPWLNYAKGELPMLWEAQVASLKIPKTGLVVTTDIVDNIKDIHPRNKWDVGDRLALWALAKTYGKKDLIYSGPLYKSMKVEGNKIRLSFAHTGEGLKTRDGKALTEFQIAGEDGKFVSASAEIEDRTVVVSAEGVDRPTQVQFGWHKTAQPNLVNSAGLPASPFRTKGWRGGTGE